MATYKTLVRTAAAAACLTGMVASANAAIVNFTLEGNVVFAPSNTFVVAPGDTVLVSGQFDDGVLTAGTGTIDFGLTGNWFDFTVGSTTFTDGQDAFGGAFMQLLNGQLDTVTVDTWGFSFTVEGLPMVDSFQGYFDLRDSNGQLVSGTWGDVTMSAVPVPAAVWLFGSGLLGLVGVARRKAAA